MSILGQEDRIAGLAMSAAATPSLVALGAEGCAVTAHAAAGVYTITLDRPADEAECVTLVTPRTVGLIGSVVHTSDTVKTVTFATAAGVNTDTAFDFAVFRMR